MGYRLSVWGVNTVKTRCGIGRITVIDAKDDLLVARYEGPTCGRRCLLERGGRGGVKCPEFSSFFITIVVRASGVCRDGYCDIPDKVMEVIKMAKPVSNIEYSCPEGVCMVRVAGFNPIEDMYDYRRVGKVIVTQLDIV